MSINCNSCYLDLSLRCRTTSLWPIVSLVYFTPLTMGTIFMPSTMSMVVVASPGGTVLTMFIVVLCLEETFTVVSAMNGHLA